MLRWHLVEQQHRGEGILGRSFPGLQPFGRRRLVIDQKLAVQRGVEFGIAFEPNFAVLVAAGITRRAKPKIE